MTDKATISSQAEEIKLLKEKVIYLEKKVFFSVRTATEVEYQERLYQFIPCTVEKSLKEESKPRS